MSTTETIQQSSAQLIPTRSWSEKAEDKRQRILASIPASFKHEELKHSLEDPASVQDVPSKLLSPLELEITALDAAALAKTIAEKKYTAVAALNAFTHRAAIAHKLLHCCLDLPYEQALQEAQALDQHLEATGKPVGALHGVPISVKDQCRLKGTETTCGFVHPIGEKDEDDAIIVDLLKQSGAVIFGKTSLSIGCMWGETINNILGRTSNPYNRSFSCGGSSGGEGALIGFHGSPLGFGTDLGGSIRSPSAYQGLYGLKPTYGRLPYYRMKNSMEGQETIKSVVGPMATTLESVELACKAIIDGKPWLLDPYCLPMPWRPELTSETQSKKLRIGLLEFDDVCLPQPPIRNALKRAAAALAADGHEIIPWKVDQVRAVELILSVFRSDAAADIRRSCAKSGEPPLESACDSSKPPIGLLESWDVAMQCLNFRAGVAKAWAATANESGRVMDAYIAPVVPTVAPRHGDYSKIRYFAYTATVNLLDHPACTVPVGFVDPSKDLPDKESLCEDAQGNLLPAVTGERDKEIRSRYSTEAGAKGYEGLPIALQVVGQRYEEEKLLGIVRCVKESIDRSEKN